jgi:DNA-binding transcriptional ArsR family regulator
VLIADLLRALGDPSRLAIMSALCAGPLYVTELARVISLEQPLVSKGLAYLRRRGLVIRERQGRRVYYRVQSARTCELVCVAAELLADTSADASVDTLIDA